MDEYISREATVKAFCEKCKGYYDGHCVHRGECDIDVIQIAPAADVQPVDRWIDAQKNTPPIIDRESMTSESVLILRDNGRYAVAYYCNDAEDGSYWTTDDDKTMYCWEEVIYWQPLPELPKGREAETTEPKPCPFCSGRAVNCMKQYDGRIYRYRIQCDNAGCACRTPWLCYQEDAIEVWNRRAVK